MRLSIRHEIRYEYDEPVFVEPHILRLRPLNNPAQQLLSARIAIDPAPQVLTQASDVEDNDAMFACFEGTTDRLRIVAESEVSTLVSNPFDYIIDEDAATLGEIYDPPLARQLQSCLGLRSDTPSVGTGREDSQDGETDLDRFAASIAVKTDRNTLDFLTALNSNLNSRFQLIVREHGDPLPPTATLHLDSASCRDIAVLFIDICRRVGIAARFVSGYALPDPGSKRHYMHAWAQVYLPGAGWRGYDPSAGLAVAGSYVAVAKSADPKHAAPVTGSFRGTGATSTMTADVKISAAGD